LWSCYQKEEEERKQFFFSCEFNFNARHIITRRRVVSQKQNIWLAYQKNKKTHTRTKPRKRWKDSGASIIVA
jgi:hypothetical protein